MFENEALGRGRVVLCVGHVVKLATDVISRFEKRNVCIILDKAESAQTGHTCADNGDSGTTH